MASGRTPVKRPAILKDAGVLKPLEKKEKRQTMDLTKTT
jgi:hypothetical protein